MLWIDFSRTDIYAMVILHAPHSFNNDFFAGTVLSSIVGKRALSHPELKARETFLRFGNAGPHFASDKCDKFAMKRKNGKPLRVKMDYEIS
jgi:hypothetical protein